MRDLGTPASGEGEETTTSNHFCMISASDVTGPRRLIGVIDAAEHETRRARRQFKITLHVNTGPHGCDNDLKARISNVTPW